MSTTFRGLPAALILVALTSGFSRHVLAQGPTVALRTTGTIMRPGDCLRLEALALDDMPGPLSAEVTYRYAVPVVVRDKDGNESTATKPVVLRRPAGPTMEGLNRLQLHLLDDTFCFGQGAVPGRYDVEVALRSGPSGTVVASLRTCVAFDDTNAFAAPAGPACDFLVRGLKRAESEDLLTLDADLPPGGVYRGALLRGSSVEAVLDEGVFATGPHELTVLIPGLAQQPGGAVDLVVVERFSHASSTVVRLALPAIR